uniref:Chromo domain-containing protein n=1 Tax=Panagrolaimus sp. JU765 TaxID=591449 RepID=A0AC34Q6M9_9BILA
MPINTRASASIKKKKKVPAPKKGEKPKKIVSTERQYIVSKILDRRLKNGAVEYLIKWKNFGSNENSWESAEKCNCPELIAQFEKQHQKSVVRTVRAKASRPVLERQMPEVVSREEHEALVEQMNKLREELEEVKGWVVPKVENRSD